MNNRPPNPTPAVFDWLMELRPRTYSCDWAIMMLSAVNLELGLRWLHDRIDDDYYERVMGEALRSRR